MRSHQWISNEKIEITAEQRFHEYEKKFKIISYPPIPIEKIIQQVYGLTISWDTIEEMQGEIILGGLNVQDKVIVLNEKHIDLYNEKHIDLYNEKSGIERSTIGHETDPWEYDVKKRELQHTFFTKIEQCNPIFYRSTEKSGSVNILRSDILPNTNKDSLIKTIFGRDTDHQRRVVNRFSAALNMPRKLIRKVTKEYDLLIWPELYKMAELFNVTISALSVRLQQLNYIYIDELGEIHSSKEEVLGQKVIF